MVKVYLWIFSEHSERVTCEIFLNLDDFTWNDPISIGLPDGCLHSLDWLHIIGNFFPVLKLILHIWWYIVPAAHKSYTYSILLCTSWAQESLHILHTSRIIALKSAVLTGNTSYPISFQNVLLDDNKTMFII